MNSGVLTGAIARGEEHRPEPRRAPRHPRVPPPTTGYEASLEAHTVVAGGGGTCSLPEVVGLVSRTAGAHGGDGRLQDVVVGWGGYDWEV